MLISRLATAGILLAACVSSLLFLPNTWWTALLFPVLMVAAWEWCALARLERSARWLFLACILISAGGLWMAAADAGPDSGRAVSAETVAYVASGLFWLMFALPWLARRAEMRAPLVLGVVGWVLLVPTWLALARLQVDPGRLLALLGVIWLADSAAFVAGTMWGKRPLAPRISPGKTWEGAAGAAIAVAVYYVALSAAMPRWGWSGWGGVLLVAAVAVMSVVGDLFESWVKRMAGVKDSGTLLPGHGGVLDRIDSMTASLPIAALLLPYAR